MRRIVLVLALLAASCATPGSPADLARRARLAAKVDAFNACVAPVALSLAARVAVGAVGLAVTGQIGDPAAWAAMIRPLVGELEAPLQDCLATAAAPAAPAPTPAPAEGQP